MSDWRIERIEKNVHCYESISSANDDVEELLGIVEEHETQIGRFWEALRLSYDIESREEIEKDCRESWAEGTSPLEVALHFIWKRDPKEQK